MYRQGQKRLNQSSRTQGWFWGGITGLVLVSVVVVLVPVNLNLPSADENLLSVVEHKPSTLVSSSPRTVSEPVVQTVQAGAPLPALDFPLGSVEEACGLNEFPPYADYWDHKKEGKISWINNPFNSEGNWKALESQECTEALEAHMNAINPYLWGITDNWIRPFVFVVLENPLTFERIFADPGGDLARVQDVLSRPECLLQGDETDWELNETCHADALLNYALLNRFCFDEGVDYRKKTRDWPEDNPTPEQDRLMWKESLEDYWVEMKCETQSSTLELTSEQHLGIYELVMSLDQSDPQEPKKGSRELLIELAARLGDDAAGLARRAELPYSVPSGRHPYGESGREYGRFSWLFTGEQWWEFTYKEPPSVDRFQRVLSMLGLVGAPKIYPRDEIQFDWELVARHLCTPPYYTDKSWHDSLLEDLKSDERYADDLLAFREKHDKPKSCKEVVHEIRQSDIEFSPLHQALNKFEQVAIELGVYD